MVRKMKRWLSLGCACLTAAFTALAGSMVCAENIVYAEEIQETAKGTTGEVSWSFDGTGGVLTLYGQGATADYASATNAAKAAPWFAYMDDIRTVKVEAGVTYLGQRLFYGADSLAAVSLPDTLTGIGDYVFRACPLLPEILVPDSVTSLGRAAFYECTGLKKAILGGSYTSLALTFVDCGSLTEVELPASVTALAGEKAATAEFAGCVSLKTVRYGGTMAAFDTMLKETAHIGALGSDGVSVECSDGTYVYGRADLGNGMEYTLEEGVLTIHGSGAIRDYENGAEAPWAAEAEEITTIVLPQGLTGVGRGAFAGCTSLAEVWYLGYEEQMDALRAAVAPGNEPLLQKEWILGTSGSCGEQAFWTLNLDSGRMTVSGAGAMANYDSASALPWRYSLGDIRSVVVEEGITAVGDNAFSTCRNLQAIELADTVELIGVHSFSSCIALETVAIPEGVRALASKAFQSCVSLKEVHLPSTLKNIDMRAFGGDNALSDVYYGGTRQQWEEIVISMSAQDNQYLVDAKIHCLGTPVDAAQIYGDVDAEDWYVEAVQYLMEHGYLDQGETSFGGEAAAEADFVWELLYIRAGRPGMYASAREWAIGNGLAGRDAGNELSRAELALLLGRMARQNGVQIPEGKPSGELAGTEGLTAEALTALGWCEAQGYLNAPKARGGVYDVTETLTKGEAAAVLAAYLISGASRADRYREIVDTVKTAIKQGGDGYFYVVAPNLTTPGVTAKSGDCTLLVFPDGGTMMIDAGQEDCSQHVITLLRDLELTQLDYFVLSHTHSDHVGGALALAEYIYSLPGGSIANYYRTGFVSGAAEPAFMEYLRERGVNIRTDVLAGERWEMGDVGIEVYNPEAEQIASATGGETEVNNLSLVMKFTYGDSTYLTGGDIYRNHETGLVDIFGGALTADVIKANHHGTHTSNGREWLTAVSPLVMFATADDIGGTPLVELAAELGIAYYSTGLDGLLLFRMGDSRDYDVIARYDSSLRERYTGSFGKAEATGGGTDTEKPGGIDSAGGGKGDGTDGKGDGEDGKGAGGGTAEKPKPGGASTPDGGEDNGNGRPVGTADTGDGGRMGLWLVTSLLALAGAAAGLRRVSFGQAGAVAGLRRLSSGQAGLSPEPCQAGSGCAGTCGQRAFWKLEEESGRLTVWGSGPMTDWYQAGEPPWGERLSAVTGVVVERGITTVGDYAFSSCVNLTELSLADTVEKIGVCAFCGCVSLERAVLPEGVRLVASKAFQSCVLLAAVHLPSTLGNIDMRAFGGDRLLDSVYYGGTKAQWNRVTVSMAASDNHFLLQAKLHFAKTPEMEAEVCGAEALKDCPGAVQPVPLEDGGEDRYEEIVARVKSALRQGGDGYLYVLGVDLTTPGIRAKSGDCTLLLFPGGETMMIDAGYTECSGHVISLLRDLELGRLDYFVLSHSHNDHVGGGKALAAYLYGPGKGGIGVFCHSGFLEESGPAREFQKYLKDKGVSVREDLLAGNCMQVGDVAVHIYNPTEEQVKSCIGGVTEVNNLSILIKFTYGTSVYLTGGDLYRDRELELAARYGDALRADILKANHHGTYTSNCPEWLRTVSPRALVAPADDIGGTPLAELAAEMGIDYYSVHMDGLVLCRMGQRRDYEIITRYDSSLRKIGGFREKNL